VRKIMIFQHVGHEPLGTLNPMLKAAGFRIRYVNFGRHPDFQPSLDGYNGLIVLGGPMGVYEADKHPHLAVELKAIEAALKRDIPVLGICLGAQLVAATLGARVRTAPQWEMGWYDVHLTEKGATDPLFAGYGKCEKVFQLHQDTFDVPETADHLAFTSLCDGQAFRYGDKVYGLQFHLEADRPMIRRWMQRPENRKLIEGSQGLFCSNRIEEDTKAHIGRSLDLSHQTFRRFMDIFGLPERPVVLGSR
jgi:GMP synthase (glutamine-hydrolysing)